MINGCTEVNLTKVDVLTGNIITIMINYNQLQL